MKGAIHSGLDGSSIPKAVEISRTRGGTRSADTVQIVRGHDRILAMRSLLIELALCCDQPGAADHLDYSLLPGFTEKKPILLLIHARDARGADAEKMVNGVAGAVLLFEFRALGLGSRVFASSDATGRRTLIGPANLRREIAELAGSHLVRQGAQIVHATYHLGCGEAFLQRQDEAMERNSQVHKGRGLVWSAVEQEIPFYLPLMDTFEATLARIGQKTRSNLRYYRRRAERDLGCVFVPQALLSREEFVEFNRRTSFAASDAVAGWRYDAWQRLDGVFLSGVRDRDGRWLAIVGGRRSNHAIEIEWQMNRADLPAYSLSTVLRSYLIEHEIGLGANRLYVEGGTGTAIQHSFVKETAVSLTVCRRSAYAWMVRRIASRFLPGSNQMVQVLRDRSRIWRAG